MSCCPTAPAIKVSSDAPPIEGPEQELRSGETVECFSKRAGNSTGALDDAVEARPNTIANESVNSDCAAKLDVTFRMTSNTAAGSVTWTMSPASVGGVTLTTNGRLVGVVAPAEQDKKQTITVTATFAGGSDNRTYSFSAGICKGGDSIRFLTPLVTGFISSKYGMRFHPIQKIDKLHTGVDMVMPVKNVNGDIIAAADGVVIKSKNTDPRGYGLAIHIKHLNSKGGHLCTTTYNHLYRSLVNEGDKVSAGQKIALEGGARGDPGSGGSTGLHLHFECKLPDGSFTDPAPYLRGAVQVAGNQTAPGVPAPGTTTTQQPSGAAMTSADAAAKSDCPPTETYPQDPSKPETVAPADQAPVVASDPSTDPSTASVFEKAWFFTMKYEVGPHWSVPPGTEPTDPEIVAGLCDTVAQKKKCGYKMWIASSGGETKFGIAKSGNPRTDIKGLTYKATKDIGYANYWKRGKKNPSTIATTNNAPYLAVFMFDTNFQHGDGNGRTIWEDSAVGSTWPDKEAQMVALEKLYVRRLSFANTLKNVADRKGVANRVTACFAYVKGLNL